MIITTDPGREVPVHRPFRLPLLRLLRRKPLPQYEIEKLLRRCAARAQRDQATTQAFLIHQIVGRGF